MLLKRNASAFMFSLLADAEGGEDAVEDVVGGGGAGDGVDGLEGGVEVEQQHFVGDAGQGRPAASLRRAPGRTYWPRPSRARGRAAGTLPGGGAR